MLARSFLSTLTLAVGMLAVIDSPRDRRIVDTVHAGVAQSESEHGYAGHEAFVGTAGQKSYRQARGYMRYALTSFDDTEVTIACTFLRLGGDKSSYDLVVEDSLIATREFVAQSDTTTVVEIKVPFVVTRGRTNISVTIRARNGVTPALTELRVIQDHHEVALPSPNPTGVAR